MNFSENYFEKDYESLTRKYELQKEILEKLKKIQLNEELIETVKVKNGMIRSNLNQNSP